MSDETAAPGERRIGEFDPTEPLPTGMTVIEASAGTGKTFTLTALVARFIAEGRAESSQLLMMTFTRAAAAEMRERTRARLVEVREALRLGSARGQSWLEPIVDVADAEREVRHDRISRALATLDEATITTIHGFCQQTLAETGVLAGDVASGEVTEQSALLVRSLVRDRLVALLGERPDALGPVGDLSLAEVEKNLLKIVNAALANQGAGLAPRDAEPGSPEATWVDTARRLVESVTVARLHRGIAGFDDLITGVAAMLGDPATADALIARSRDRFRLVLVDEFQDTDIVQWEILRRLFVAPHPAATAPAVVCVGDPKQAIYRFRGADIEAYLRAVTESEAQRSELRTNWRADGNLVAATNRLMAGLDLGQGQIPYVEVDARPGAPDCAMDDGVSLELRWLPTTVRLDGSDTQKAETVRARIAADLGDEVVRLLGTEIGSGSERRRVQPSDIAVLLRAHEDAIPILDALRARRVPAVQSKIGSVTDSEAMGELRLLASALAGPGDLRRVRALGLGWFVSEEASLTVALDDERAASALQQRCERWERDLREHGIVAFFERLRTDSDLLGKLAHHGMIERGLTDLEHIVELVHRHTKGAGISGAVLERVLGEIAGAEETTEVEQRRTDTDSTAVTLTSMHGVKGLEYPIVLVPFPKPPLSNRKPDMFSVDGRRFIDAAPGVKWTDRDTGPKERTELAGREVKEDELRLIYVSLTRPRHRLTIWWGKWKGVETGSLSRVLFHRPDQTEASAPPKGDDAVRAAFAALADRVGPAMRVVELGPRPDGDPPRYTAPLPDLSGARVAMIPTTAAPRDDWFRWSFSSLAGSVGAGGGLDEVRAGHDEGDPATEELTATPDSEAEITGALLGLPASAAFGVLVHDVLEAADFAAPDATAELSRLIRADSRTTTLGVAPELLVEGLAATMATPLTGLAEGRTLAGLDRTDRLAELGFHLPIADGAAPLPRAAFVDAAIANEPPEIAAAFAEIRASWSGAEIRGLLTGSIDALLRLDGRYFVVDYKTNRLHPPDGPATVAHYGWPGMLDAMRHHRYLLQALVYSVATHRFLATRVADYDPEHHLGGVGYLFVRGMVGAATPAIDGTACGVFTWRPTVTTILATDRAIGGTR